MLIFLFLMKSFFVGIFIYDFSLGTDFTCSNKVPPQFQNLRKAIKTSYNTLSLKGIRNTNEEMSKV